MKAILGRLCSIWLATSTMEVVLQMTGIVSAYFQFSRNTTIKMSSITRNMSFHHLNSIMFLNTPISKPINNIFKNCPTLKIQKFLVCMKMLISHIKIKNQLKSWRLFLTSNREYHLQQVVNHQMRLWWKWQHNSPLWYHNFWMKLQVINNILN